MAWFWPILGMVMVLPGTVTIGSVWIWQWGGIWLIVGVLGELGG